MRAMLLSWLLCTTLCFADELPPAPRVIVSTEIVVLDPMNFAENSALLEPGVSATLDVLARVLKEQSLTIEIAGHADPTTEKKTAAKLATQRAKAARAYLIAQGVDPRRLTAKGYADTRPLTAGASAAESRANRRVEARSVDAK